MECIVNRDLALANAESLRTPEKCNPAVANAAEILRPLDSAVISIIVDQIRPYLSLSGDRKADAARRIRELVIALNDVRSTLGLPALKSLSQSGVSTVIDAILTTASTRLPNTAPKRTKGEQASVKCAGIEILMQITVPAKKDPEVSFTHTLGEREFGSAVVKPGVSRVADAAGIKAASSPQMRGHIDRSISELQLRSNAA